MLGVGSGGDEFHSISCQHAQESFTALVDERDFAEIHDTKTSHIRSVALPPARPELLYPGVGKQAMQNPSFFRRCFTEIDLQHDVFLRACPRKDSLQDWPACDDVRFCLCREIARDNTERDRKYDRLDIQFISPPGLRRCSCCTLP